MSSVEYRPDIQGLRAFAVILVLLFHFFPGKISGGFIGVDIFFVISGFVITSKILRDMKEGSFSIILFFKSRIVRLFPALVVTFFFCLIIGWFLLGLSDYFKLSKHIATFGIISNLLALESVRYFDVSSQSKTLLNLWSLGVEFQFYLVWPFVLILISKIKDRVIQYVLVILLMAISALYCFYITYQNPSLAFYSPLSRCWEFLIGAAIAMRTIKFHNAAGGGVTIACFFVLIVASIILSQNYIYPGYWVLLPVICSGVIIALPNKEHFLYKLLSIKLAQYTGAISYPLYLIHWPIISFLYIHNGYFKLGIFQKLGALFVSIAGAIFIYEFIELKLRKKENGLILFISCLTLFLFACSVLYLDGYKNRSIVQSKKQQFLEYYRDMHLNRLDSYYRLSCDYYDNKTGQVKNNIEKSCLNHNASVFLWGDSHAQALSYGLKLVLGGYKNYSQIATSGCHPIFDQKAKNGFNPKACKKSNIKALNFIKTTKPSLVIITQANNFDINQIIKIKNIIEKYGGLLVVVGPVPQWDGGLPNIVVKSLWDNKSSYSGLGLNDKIFIEDFLLKKSLQNIENVIYVSAVDAFCKGNECMVRVGDDPYNLTALDYGHITPQASLFLVRKIFKNSELQRHINN